MRNFNIYKFRSMRAEALDHAGNRSASRDDSGWTVWRDLSIMLATFKVLVHKNAF